MCFVMGFCCGAFAYLFNDGRIIEKGEKDDRYYELWTSRDANDGDWEPETCILFYCPNCGTKL